MIRSVLLVALGTISFGLAATPFDETKGPAQRFQLEIDGKQYQVVSGEPTQLKIRGRKHTVMVAPLPTKRLDREQLSFDYPQEMSFAYLDSTVMQTWTLTGTNASLTLHRLEGMSAKDFIKTLLKNFGKSFKASKFGEQASSLSMGGKQVKGLVSRWISGPITLQYEMYAVRPKGAQQFLFMFNSALQDGEPHADLAHLRELVENSFEYAK